MRDVPEPLISGNQVVCEGDLMGQPLVLESGQFQGGRLHTNGKNSLTVSDVNSGAEASSYLSDSGIFQNAEFRWLLGLLNRQALVTINPPRWRSTSTLSKRESYKVPWSCARG